MEVTSVRYLITVAYVSAFPERINPTIAAQLSAIISSGMKCSSLRPNFLLNILFIMDKKIIEKICDINFLIEMF